MTHPSRSRMDFATPAALVLVALLVPAYARSAGTSDAAERYTLRGKSIAVYNLAGSMVLEPAPGGEATVEVTRGGDDAGQLKIATGDVDGRASLRVVYPGNHVIYPEMGRGSNTTIRVRDDGTFGGKESHLFGRQVKISGSGSGVEAHADLHVLVPRGSDVLVRLASGETQVMKVESKLFVDIACGTVTTNDTKGSLGIDTGSGSVKVTGASGPVSIDTGSGSVSAKAVKGDELAIDTGSGRVEASNVDVQSLEVDTGSGHVDLDGVKAHKVHVDTGSGGVTLAFESIVDDLVVDTGSGGVEVSMPKETGAMVALETGSGSIDVDLPMTSVHRDHGELHGQLGDGKGRITIETGSGGISIGPRSSSVN